MNTAVTAMLLAASLAGVAAPAHGPTNVVGVSRVPTSMGWSTGGFAPDPPPPPLPADCQPDSTDPTCHPPPPPVHHHHGFL